MTEKPFASGALEVNLAQTRRDNIVIPGEQQLLLRISLEHWGIHKRTRSFLTEWNHPFANYQILGDEYRKVLLGDRWLYQQSDQAQQAMQLLIDMGVSVFSKPVKNSEAAQFLLCLIEMGGFLHEWSLDHRNVLSEALFEALRQVYSKRPELLIRYSGLFRKHILQSEAGKTQNKWLVLARDIFVDVSHYWEKHSQISQWYNDKKALFSQDYQGLIHQLDHHLFESIRRQAINANSAQELARVAVWGEISAKYTEAIGSFARSIERFYYILFLMHMKGLEDQHDRLLWELNKVLRHVCEELDNEEMTEFIRTVFSLFAELRTHHMSMVLDCVLTLGKEIIALSDRRLISFFENSLIDLGFVHPGKVFIQENWQLQVDPNHIKNIRVWLELIEHAPNTFRKLLSALIVNLRLGGVFIFDTDLFQRDITRLLNSDISPLFKQIKQLTRIFPVYFNEIGAEGELREVTTHMDELSGRRDMLIHFLRKQIHTEGNNSHIDLSRTIFRFWQHGRKEELLSLIPEDVYRAVDTSSDYFLGVNQLLNEICRLSQKSADELLMMPEDVFRKWLTEAKSGSSSDKTRLGHLFRLYFLLGEKYSFEATDIALHLKKHPFFTEAEVESLSQALQEKNLEEVVRQTFLLMERLNRIIFDPKPSQGWESIYHKRHIAFGIPSMYGQYRETKFEALGLIFRLERLAGRCLEQMIQAFHTEHITAGSLREAYRLLELLHQGLELDGVLSQGFGSNLQMLRYGLTSESFSLEQFINLFQFMAKNVKDITHTYFFGFYDQPLRVIIPRLSDPESKLSEKEMNRMLIRQSEVFYRELLASSFLIQLLDGFISRMIHALQHMVDHYSTEIINHIMSYDPELVVSPLYAPSSRTDNQIFLGSKAYFQKMLYQKGFPVPVGFVLTTEVFRRRKAILSSPSLSQQVDNLIRQSLRELELKCGMRYGHARRPLMLSVRSGTAISMPGAMNTFLNVGLNDHITELLSRQPDMAWTSWDCYRRLLQSWGMTYGINRDEFDQVMIEFKNKYHVELKIHFTPEQMREMALSYKKILKKHRVHFEEDPWKQLRQAIMSVFDSWESNRARAYRNHLQIADQWGTAVVIQKMVLGNLNENSGTGVVFTHNPQLQKPGIYLNGDFSLCSQGEDIVGGLVHALPVSDLQKKISGRDHQLSLQQQLPDIYKRLNELSRELVDRHGFNHQEIEFTFESDQPDSLFILQIRDQDTHKPESLQVFSSEASQMKLLGRGIGGGGGALNGRVAIDMNDMIYLQKEYPGESCVLLRPDTVPDDIPMIFACDGLVTARGGTTSHAAVTAARLGKVCVLSCQQLQVDEKNKTCQINGYTLHPGDRISIDGFSGNIFRGHYPTETTEVIHQHTNTP